MFSCIKDYYIWHMTRPLDPQQKSVLCRQFFIFIFNYALNWSFLKIQLLVSNVQFMCYAGSFFFWFKHIQKGRCSLFWFCWQTEARFNEKLFGLVFLFVKVSKIFAFYISHMLPLTISHVFSHPPPAFGLSEDLELAFEAKKLQVQHGNNTVPR